VAQIMNLHMLGRASTKAGVLVVERLGGWLDPNVGGYRPEDLIDGSEVWGWRRSGRIPRVRSGPR
jgi:hypothetical protein